MFDNQLFIKLTKKNILIITNDKITEIFCAVDEFCKEFDKQMEKNHFYPLMATNVTSANPLFPTVKL